MLTHENTVARSPMKATEKYFDILRKARVITKFLQNVVESVIFLQIKVKFGEFLRKSVSLDTWTVANPLLFAYLELKDKLVTQPIQKLIG